MSQTHGQDGETPDHPRILHTRSGSVYRLDGRDVEQLEGQRAGQVFQLVDLRRNRLRYTDGEQLFISSEVVAA